LCFENFYWYISNWYFSNGIYQNPLENEEENSNLGRVLFKVKGKAFETGGEISNLENASYNLIHIPLTICKKILKRLFQKNLRKQTSGASVVHNVK
jgi:hypothetical protein